MQMAMRHLKAEDARKEAQSLGIMDVSKETARKVRQAVKRRYGVELTPDPVFLPAADL